MPFSTVNNGSGGTDDMVTAKDDVPADHVPNDRATSLIVMPIEIPLKVPEDCNGDGTAWREQNVKNCLG